MVGWCIACTMSIKIYVVLRYTNPPIPNLEPSLFLNLPPYILTLPLSHATLSLLT